MTRVVVHIRRLVVQGTGRFSGEAFEAALRQEVAQRLGSGADAAGIAERLRAADASPRAPGATALAGAGRTAEQRAAARLAGRLLR